MQNKITIEGIEYEIIDQIDSVSIADSFVLKNKIGIGHGEAKLYIGSQNRQTEFTNFFGDFTQKAVFLKKDFVDYLDDAKFEYEEQEQGYQKDIAVHWDDYKSESLSLQEVEPFVIFQQWGPEDNARYYISSNDRIWKFFRTIVLPIISHLSILKLKNEQEEILFLFRITLDYFFNKNYHPATIERQEENIEHNASLPKEKKEKLLQARKGQGQYRKDLLDEKSECIITRINDERLLIASHIKPWSVSDEKEKVDHYNGLALSPTYDRMFDQGFISFEDDATILISPYISPLNLRKLNLVPDKKYDIPNIDKRKEYLKYHRTNIFKG